MKICWPAVLAVCCSACSLLSDGQTAAVQVFRSDGSRQCDGGGISAETMRQQLHGLRVYAAEQGVLADRAYPAVCGGETGRINIYTVAAADEAEAVRRGFRRLPPPASF